MKPTTYYAIEFKYISGVPMKNVKPGWNIVYDFVDNTVAVFNRKKDAERRLSTYPIDAMVDYRIVPVRLSRIGRNHKAIRRKIKKGE